MSAVPAAVSVSVRAPRAPRAPSRRPVRSGRQMPAGLVRRRASGRTDTMPDPASAPLVPALLALAALAAFAVLCLPALRAQLAIGWLPLWLLLAPLSAAGALAATRGLSDRSRVSHR